MKSKLIVLAAACFIGIRSPAQNTIPPKTNFVAPTVPVKLTTVSAVTIVQDAVTSIAGHNGQPGTQLYHFKGTISSSGPGTITYKWAIISTGNTAVPPVYKAGSLIPGGTGTDSIFVDMGNGGNGLFKITLLVLSPGQVTSNSITY